jgi:hypothetical protein
MSNKTLLTPCTLGILHVFAMRWQRCRCSFRRCRSRHRCGLLSVQSQILRSESGDATYSWWSMRKRWRANYCQGKMTGGAGCTLQREITKICLPNSRTTRLGGGERASERSECRARGCWDTLHERRYISLSLRHHCYDDVRAKDLATAVCAAIVRTSATGICAPL